MPRMPAGCAGHTSTVAGTADLPTPSTTASAEETTPIDEEPTEQAPPRVEGVDEGVNIFTQASDKNWTKTHQVFFRDVILSPHGGLNEVPDLFCASRYVSTVVFFGFLALNLKAIFYDNWLMINHLQSRKPFSLSLLVLGFADSDLHPGKIVILFEFCCALCLLALIAYKFYVAACPAKRGSAELTYEENYRRWRAVASIFMHLLPHLQLFSAMSVLHRLAPSVFLPDLSNLLHFAKERDYKHKALVVVWFVLLRLAALLFGFDAFICKLSNATELLPKLGDCPIASLELIGFLIQILGVLPVDLLIKKRLVRFIFGGVNGFMEPHEVEVMRAWEAAFHERAWQHYGDFPLRFLAVVTTFTDLDFQTLVLDEVEEKKEK